MTPCCPCGAPLLRKRWRPGAWENLRDFQRRRFCSRPCEARARGPRKAVVSLRALRFRARKHRQWLCECCSGFPVDAHHRDGNVRNNVPANIATLCRACHAAADMALRCAPMPWEWKRA